MAAGASPLLAATPLAGIRHTEPSDALLEYLWRRDPELARLNLREPITQPYHRFAEEFADSLRLNDPSARLFAILDCDGRHIGSAAYYGASHAAGSAELGILIGDERHRSQGAGSHALVAFLRMFWRDTPFREMRLRTLAGNIAARRCFEKCGFEQAAPPRGDEETIIRMAVAREWWLLWDSQGRFSFAPPRV